LTISTLALKGRRSFASTSTHKADITLTVDGKEVTVPQGVTPVLQRVPTPILILLIGSALIQACEAAGATIPRCIHFRLDVAQHAYGSDIRSGFATMTDLRSRATVGEHIGVSLLTVFS
jgi:hypothetical protein